MKRLGMLILGWLAAIPATWAQEVPGAGYDCWIGNAGAQHTTHFIRCIASTEMGLLDRQAGDGEHEVVLELIRRYLRSGAIREAEATLRQQAHRLRSSDYASLLLYSYPAEWSWQEARPQMLVQSALCRDNWRCRVNFYRR